MEILTGAPSSWLAAAAQQTWVIRVNGLDDVQKQIFKNELSTLSIYDYEGTDELLLFIPWSKLNEDEDLRKLMTGARPPMRFVTPCLNTLCQKFGFRIISHSHTQSVSRKDCFKTEFLWTLQIVSSN